MNSKRTSILSFQPSTTKGKSAERLVDVVQKFLRSIQTEWYTRGIDVFHVVRTFHVFHNIATTSGSKSFNSVEFTFFHFHGVVTSSHNGDNLCCVDLIMTNGVSTEVSNGTNGLQLSGCQFHLEGFHDFLDFLTDITYPYINTSGTYSCLCCFFDCLQERIILWIETHRPGTVNDTSFDLNSKINLHDIVVCQDGIITGIGCVMSRHMVERTSCGKRNAALQTTLAHQFTVLRFQLFAHVNERNAWANNGLCIASNLTMYFCRMAQTLLQILL
mmetsp:Transcript_14248/g.21695  ORF Transcript_14248/g.21695 Transcript_14248/m.21695 type:complete len:273 (+) Transcript_14248:270-1088(+)